MSCGYLGWTLSMPEPLDPALSDLDIKTLVGRSLTQGN